MKTSISSVDGVAVFCMHSTVMLLVDIKVFSSIRTGGEGLKKIVRILIFCHGVVPAYYPPLSFQICLTESCI